ncbi:MAG: hypothetical protein AB7R69_05840 [Candidatus Babeliales bacterium]
MSKIVLTSILLIFSSLSFGENYMAILGAGGEPKDKDTTIFDIDIPPLSEMQQNLNWKTTLLYNGGHKKTEKFLKKNFVEMEVKAESFTTENYKKLIESYKEKILNGEIKEGDQLMLLYNTHGSKASGKTHKILTSDSRVSLDELEELIKLANEKNVKMAILDTSCHSGSTLNLANEKTCIISSSGPEQISLSEKGFSNSLFKNMKPGKTLEDIFLETLNRNKDPSFPMISSGPGLELNDLLYKKISSFLTFYDHDKNSSLEQLLKEKILTNQSCSEGLDALTELADTTSALEVISSKYTADQAKRFKKSLKSYLNLQEELREKLSDTGYRELLIKDQICTNGFCMTYTREELLQLNIPELKTEYQLLLRANLTARNKHLNVLARASLENLKKFEEIKTRLLATPNLAKASDFFERQLLLAWRTQSHALKIGKELSQLYVALYKQKSIKDKKPNPCRDFKL